MRSFYIISARIYALDFATRLTSNQLLSRRNLLCIDRAWILKKNVRIAKKSLYKKDRSDLDNESERYSVTTESKICRLWALIIAERAKGTTGHCTI
jgi:hypothetical protein